MKGRYLGSNVCLGNIWRVVGGYWANSFFFCCEIKTELWAETFRPTQHTHISKFPTQYLTSSISTLTKKKLPRNFFLKMATHGNWACFRSLKIRVSETYKYNRLEVWVFRNFFAKLVSLWVSLDFNFQLKYCHQLIFKGFSWKKIFFSIFHHVPRDLRHHNKFYYRQNSFEKL